MKLPVDVIMGLAFKLPQEEGKIEIDMKVNSGECHVKDIVEELISKSRTD